MAECVICGELLTNKQGKYCCRAHQTQSQWLHEKCCAYDGCKKVFRPKKKETKYCSRQCAAFGTAIRHPDEIRDRLIELHATGMGFRKIAATLDISVNAVCGLRRRLGLEPKVRQRKGPPQRAWSRRHPEDLPPTVRMALHERITAGAEPLPPMHPISWGAIAL